MNSPKRPPTGFILYEGPSLLDGSPIVAIVTGTSRRSVNAKTGDMLQTYIIRSDVDPVTAAREGADASVCGDCKHRPANGGACYVTLIHGPASVYRAFKRGAYSDACLPGPLESTTTARGKVAPVLAALGRGRMVRLGTYGDPAAVPAAVWEALVSEAQGRTGYTHQWARVTNRAGGQSPQLETLKRLVMASADSAQEMADAQALGWRTFRVMAPGEALQRGEFTCPASEEAGKVKTCATCGACDGSERGAQKASAAILVHGTKARRFISISPA